MLAYLITDKHRLHSVLDLADKAQTIIRADYALLSEKFIDGYMADNKLDTPDAALTALGISYDSEALNGSL